MRQNHVQMNVLNHHLTGAQLSLCFTVVSVVTVMFPYYKALNALIKVTIYF